MKEVAKNLRFFFLVCVFLALTGLALAQTQLPNPQQIVDRNFPQTLIDELKARGLNWKHQSCFAVYDTLPNGAPRTIMAGYSDGISGAIRVIQADSSGQYGVIFEPVDLDLNGIDCSVALKDMDGDGKNEVIYSFDSFKMNSVDWLFRWNGSQLVNLAPDLIVRSKPKPGHFFNMALIDLYHDGTLQVVRGGEYPPPADGSLPSVAETLYRLEGSKFVEVGSNFFSVVFVRQDGAPTPDSEWFQLVQRATGPYMLHLTNGDKDGKNRVSGAHVVLNGTEVVSPQQLNQTVEFLDVAINSLLSNNRIDVTLEGAIGSKITLIVTGTVSPSK